MDLLDDGEEDEGDGLVERVVGGGDGHFLSLLADLQFHVGIRLVETLHGGHFRSVHLQVLLGLGQVVLIHLL